MLKLAMKYLMLALDQRGSFEKLLGTTNKGILAKKKGQIIESLQDLFSGVLIDPDYGLEGYKQVGCKKPFLLCVEKSGYENVEGERLTEILYSPSFIKQTGAYGAKLLVYFNPFLKSANKQLETARKVLADCKKNNLPLFFEIVTYGDSFGKNLIVESVDFFLKNDFKPDVFKLEYPGSEMDCQTVTKLIGGIPWIMLTGGADFDTFYQRLIIAAKNGCSGFLAGRAIWQDVVTNEISETEKQLMRLRFEKIIKIAIGK